MTATIGELAELWGVLFPGVPALDKGQWNLWLMRHSNATVRLGIAETAVKYRKLDGNMDAGYVTRFASSVMNRISRESAKGEHRTVTPEQAVYLMGVVESEFGIDSESGARLMLTLLERPDDFTSAYLETHLNQDNHFRRMARKFLVEYGMNASFEDMRHFMAQR